MKTTKITIYIFFALLAGCIKPATTLDYQRASTGRVPCSPSEIKISQVNKYNLGSTWTAECKGHIYYCTAKATPSGNGGFVEETACTK